eukprot:3446702-Rhodomonas_salina.2
MVWVSDGRSEAPREGGSKGGGPRQAGRETGKGKRERRTGERRKRERGKEREEGREGPGVLGELGDVSAMVDLPRPRDVRPLRLPLVSSHTIALSLTPQRGDPWSSVCCACGETLNPNEAEVQQVGCGGWAHTRPRKK